MSSVSDEKGMYARSVAVGVVGPKSSGKSTLVGQLLWRHGAQHFQHLAAKQSRDTAAASEVGTNLWARSVTGGIEMRGDGTSKHTEVWHVKTKSPSTSIALVDTPGTTAHHKNFRTGLTLSDCLLLVVDGNAQASAKHSLSLPLPASATASPDVSPSASPQLAPSSPGNPSHRGVDETPYLSGTDLERVFVARAFGLKHVVCAISKLELAADSHKAYALAVKALSSVLSSQMGFTVSFVPTSANLQWNVVSSSTSKPFVPCKHSQAFKWYQGPTLYQVLLSTIEQVQPWVPQLTPPSMSAPDMSRLYIQVYGLSWARKSNRDEASRLCVLHGYVRRGQLKLKDTVSLVPAATSYLARDMRVLQARVSSIRMCANQVSVTEVSAGAFITFALDVPRRFNMLKTRGLSILHCIKPKSLQLMTKQSSQVASFCASVKWLPGTYGRVWRYRSDFSETHAVFRNGANSSCRTRVYRQDGAPLGTMVRKKKFKAAIFAVPVRPVFTWIGAPVVLLDNGLLCFGTVSHVEYVAQYIPPIVLQRRGVPVGQEDKQPQLALGIDVTAALKRVMRAGAPMAQMLACVEAGAPVHLTGYNRRRISTIMDGRAVQTFCMGLDSRVGSRSSIYTSFRSSPLFDKNLVRMIFELMPRGAHSTDHTGLFPPHPPFISRYITAAKKWAVASALRKQRGHPSQSIPLRRLRLPKPASMWPFGQPQAAQRKASGSASPLERCYVCKRKFPSQPDSPGRRRLCTDCAPTNALKRSQSQDMTGCVCLVTGARVKIGFEVGLKLLRAGALVIVTTRFPRNAVKRYAQQPDCQDWWARLHVYGLDFRSLPHVHAFIAHVLAHYPRLDVLINNAAQTIRRPPAFYRHLMEEELAQDKAWAPIKELQADPFAKDPVNPPDVTALGPAGQPEHDTAPTSASSDSPQTVLTVAVPSPTASCRDSAVALSTQWSPTSSARLSQMPLLPSDTMEDHQASKLFPTNARDQNDQQLDLRRQTSWVARSHEVAVAEMMEVQMVNQIVPFTLVSRLKALMQRSPPLNARKKRVNANIRNFKFIVNVSSPEGQFSMPKDGSHVHTNMAKAALNMLTRTCAREYSHDRIYMNSVDTGWVTRMTPLGRVLQPDSAATEELKGADAPTAPKGTGHEDEKKTGNGGSSTGNAEPSTDDERIQSILRYWFGVKDSWSNMYTHRGYLWWRGDGTVDAEIKRRFEHLLLMAEQGQLDHWTESAEGGAALCVLCDQFPRNMYRGTARMFAFDSLAQKFALKLLDTGLVACMPPAQRMFVYLVLEHAEDKVLVRRAWELMQQLAVDTKPPQSRMFTSQANSVHEHVKIIDAYGRYPHRNAVLGRESTPAEVAYLATAKKLFFMKSVKPRKTKDQKAAARGKAAPETKTKAKAKAKATAAPPSSSSGSVVEQYRAYARGHSTPLDEVDGAARVLDPIFGYLSSDEPPFGHMFVNFEKAPW